MLMVAGALVVSADAPAAGGPMRVTFSAEGGIAFFPGLSRPVTIDQDQLSEEDAHELVRLVDECSFFDQPAKAAKTPKGAADVQLYTITVDDGEQRHTVKVQEPIADQGLRELVNFLRRKVRELRTGAKP
jgi:hypothetical protein